MSRTFSLQLAILLIILLVGGLGLAFAVPRLVHPKKAPESVACTMEARQCPDDSYVGRVGPSCEFAPCPEKRADTMSGWKTATDTQSGATFRYPETLGTQYITTTDWPPRITLERKTFSCQEGGETNAPAGRTEQRTISGHIYCVTERSEGAAGSVYSLYAYAFPENSSTAILTFGLRRVQCGNYAREEQQACEAERQDFSPDELIDQIAQSLESQKQNDPQR